MLGSSITYRIAVGPHQGRKAFSLQSLPPAGSLEESSARVAKVAGFSLHAGVAAARDERQKLERLCRYITRPAIAEPRLSLTPSGNVRYQLKTPYRDGTTHVMLLRASCPPPFGPAFGCSKSLPAIFRTAGFHGAAGGAGTKAAGESDPLPRGVCTDQPGAGLMTPGRRGKGANARCPKG